MYMTRKVASANAIRRVSIAEARRSWAKVVRTAQSGVAVEVTRNGEPVAAVVPIELLHGGRRPTISDAVARFRARTAPKDLEGPDPWIDARDRSSGRDVELE